MSEENGSQKALLLGIANLGDRLDKVEAHLESVLQQFKYMRDDIVDLGEVSDDHQYRLDQIRPIVRSCPKCTKKVGESQTTCGVCGHRL